ncbi:MAG TPA: HAMP domain-containing sensor histidine kinase [Chloroflexota bacterium]|jgi:signal transduction histidine kinase
MPAAQELGLGPLFTRIRDAVVVAEAGSGRIVLWNPAAETLLGYTSREARGQPLTRLLPGGPGEIAARRKDGEEIALEVDVFDLDADHRLVIARDVTAHRALERERGSFLAAVSHDLKSPLAAISGQAQLLQRRLEQLKLPDGPQMIRRLSRIDETTYRMSRLLEDLLDMARLQMGRPLELDRQPTDLVELARGAVQQLQPTTTRHQLEVIAEAALVMGSWDKPRIGRVLDNLLLNAIKYSPEGGQIVVAVRTEDGWGVVQVSDPGMGIPEEDLSRVFERFQRGSNAGRPTRGSGIGLAGSKHIVEQHGGTIAAESREGGGSVFTVRLPLGE